MDMGNESKKREDETIVHLCTGHCVAKVKHFVAIIMKEI